ncbi:tectonic-2 isoform X3 [Rhineura floridana]|uniref:tectonic-2 isoform X3 n=1 Tax=Rhineura floridana TaxID=261503 RepID=UPI002AC849B5|nr:tectonic-2 isoform X3 [Rhineura floridana]
MMRTLKFALIWSIPLRQHMGEINSFRPSFIYMSGTVVTASLASSPADIFSIAVADSETGMLPLADCSGRNKTGDWSLNVTYQGNVSRVTVRLTRNLQLCTSNLTDCCTEAPCLVEALQVSACRDSVVVARLLIQAEIYANTSLGNATAKDNATVIPNQVFQPLGSCPCNLTAGACDIRCCCDLECTSEMKQLFSGSCFEGVFGGDVNLPFDHLCSVQTGKNVPDWFPFLCVQSSLNNTPFLGYFYHGHSTLYILSPVATNRMIKHLGEREEKSSTAIVRQLLAPPCYVLQQIALLLQTSSPQVSSFKIPFQTIPGKHSSGYKQGEPIMTMENEYFTVPQQFIAGQCARNAPVAFLWNFEVECLTTCKEGGSMLPDTAINSGTGDSILPQVTQEEKDMDVGNCTGRECRNVTFAEDYTFIWEGKRIIEIKVTLLFGAICPEEILTQKFTVNFVSVNATSKEELSGNPGYQVGKPIRAANLNSSDAVTTLYLWKPDGKGLCRSANLTPLLFGQNSISGCTLEVDLNDSCSQLRENVTERLNSLVQASHVGKRGNSSSSVADDWVEIIRLDTSDPNTNTSLGDLKGICPDIPAHLNIQIITADVGAVEGIPQQEILGVQISFSAVTWQVQCPVVCDDKASSLPVSAAVQFIKIPAQPPVPLTRFQINYTEYDCKRNDVCWPELLYPLTRYYTGEPYSHALAKGLVLAFFILVAAVLSDPWKRIYRVWNKT